MRSRPTLLAVVSVVFACLLSGCGGDDAGDAGVTPPVEAVTTTTTAGPTTTAVLDTLPPTTAPPAVATFPTPTAAGAALFSAWTSGDRAAAGGSNLAPAVELDKLFAVAPLSGVKNRGCDDGEFGSASCFFGNGQGGVNVTLTPAPTGWSIATIDPFG